MRVYGALRQQNRGPGRLPMNVFREVTKYAERSNQLEVFDISLNFINNNDCYLLIKDLPPQIKELNLSYNRLSTECYKLLCDDLKNNYSLVSLNLQETEMSDLDLLADALMLCGVSGSLKYLNVTNNKASCKWEKCEKFFLFVREAKNMHVLRMNKLFGIASDENLPE